MSETFPSSEKLKSKILIDTLFSEGNSIKKFPIKLIYLPIKNPEISSNKTGVSVPKRNFKKAVDRIYLKRLMREAFRKNKYLVDSNLSKKYALMFIYTTNKKFELQEITECIIQLLQKLKEKDTTHENQDL
jgi:ribonuclease P protein component